MKNFHISSLLAVVFILSPIASVKAQNTGLSPQVRNNIRYFITSDNLLIAANIRSGSACSLNPGVSVVKLSNFRFTNTGGNNVRVSGRVENILTISNNLISQVSGRYQSNARMYTPSWLIRNTAYYPEFLTEMADCTTEGGLGRMQRNAPSP